MTMILLMRVRIISRQLICPLNPLETFSFFIASDLEGQGVDCSGRWCYRQCIFWGLDTFSTYKKKKDLIARILFSGWSVVLDGGGRVLFG